MKENTELQQAAVAGFPALNALPDLSKCEVEPIELVGDYWSPEKEGEKKRVFFFDFSTQSVLEQATGEERDLNIVRFVEPNGKGDYRLIRNGSARLVGQFEQMARTLNAGDAFEITYLGKKKTTNGKFADSWSVKRIILN
jgi:hypothetical protein